MVRIGICDDEKAVVYQLKEILENILQDINKPINKLFNR